MTWVLMAFTLSYALFEVPMGWWGDKYGSRGVLTRIVVWWSAFTALTGAALGLPSLILIRFLFGAGEAGAAELGVHLVALVSDRAGAAWLRELSTLPCKSAELSRPIVTAVLIKEMGWRWAFAALSIPGLLWAIAFWWWFRDEPQTHPAVNEHERQLILAGTSRRSGEHPKIPWRAVLTHPQVWLLGFILSCSAFNSYLYFFWFPTYLKKARECEDIEAGWLSSLVLAGGAIGCMSGGFVIDWLTRRTGNRFRCRRWLCFAVVLSAAVLLLIGKSCDTPLIAALWTAGSFMLAVMTLASWWGSVSDLSGRHLGAALWLDELAGRIRRHGVATLRRQFRRLDEGTRPHRPSTVGSDVLRLCRSALRLRAGVAVRRRAEIGGRQPRELLIRLAMETVQSSRRTNRLVEALAGLPLFRQQLGHQKFVRGGVLLGLGDTGNQQVAFVAELI